MAAQQLFLVKDLARSTGHSVNTVKFYLAEGLLTEWGRTPYTNFRIFNQDALERLKKIRALRKEGLSIQQIKTLLLPQPTPA